MTTITPQQAWTQMRRGNENFIAGTPEHPHQDVDTRASLAGGQAPDAALFGCADSRLAAEIIFDKGLGDLFVVRNAGQVVSDSVIGSLEYAVAVLGVPLIVVLGHDACGAVKAAIDAETKNPPNLPPHIASLIAPIRPSVRRARVIGQNDPETIGRLHLRETIAELLAGSELISDAVAAGTLGIVGANYRLSEGRVVPDAALGVIDVDAD
ncbi:carbonic anhydrase [Schumannella sp. 10F1B-5-1]|uniref:carbonic anhydrase n=1 Tax=Schumannella sp. 10F1B-5-1 TaxID=2590780 RepID=UPI001130DADD|nr:carbonic anhydrase [Schumannella sp. 10F1B-5-1]TPW73080.1 carbonic anhydrase [Schumannella sp. 10F1B-5-1]